MTEKSDDGQFTFDTNGTVEKPAHYGTELDAYGVDAPKSPRKTRLDRPEPTVFGEPPADERDSVESEQSGLCPDTDESQRQLDGRAGAETPPEWDE